MKTVAVFLGGPWDMHRSSIEHAHDFFEVMAVEGAPNAGRHRIHRHTYVRGDIHWQAKVAFPDREIVVYAWQGSRPA